MHTAKKYHQTQGTISAPSSARTCNSFVDKGIWAKTEGTKPFQDPTTVGEILLKVLIHFCIKVLFIEAKHRLTAYAFLLFFASHFTDYMPFPRTYFACSDNFINQYFVKSSWGWTFALTGAFMYLTTTVYCCGNWHQILRHFARLVIGTLIWYFWTNLFKMIETSTGQCIAKDVGLFSVKCRRTCISYGGKWTSFDISGHAFLLIWCVLFITEEARAIMGWDGIKEFIRHEEHIRGRAATSRFGAPVSDTYKETLLKHLAAVSDTFEETPLKHLAHDEFEELKTNYEKFDVIAKVVLVVLTGLTMLWDLMVLATALYFHCMIEKVVAGSIAAFMWCILYRGFYMMETSPGLPGTGMFKSTMKPKTCSCGVCKIFATIKIYSC